MPTSLPLVINRLEALDSDGLSWMWECRDHRFRVYYLSLTDTWVLERLERLTNDFNPIPTEQTDCISFREAVLHSLDYSRGMTKPA